jgi:hypothetical protein
MPRPPKPTKGQGLVAFRALAPQDMVDRLEARIAELQRAGYSLFWAERAAFREIWEQE